MSTKLRSCWNAEKTAVNGWLSSPSAFFAEIMSKKNFDSITIDLQHGLIDFRDALSRMQAIETKSLAKELPVAKWPIRISSM